MKICPACQENNHDAAERCIMCGAQLPALPERAEVRAEGEKGEVLMPAGPAALAPGTLALAVYHDREPRVVAYVPIESDMTLVGREDAVRGIFPDVDLGRLDGEAVQAEHVSREHVRLVRRPSGELVAEVLPGSTGTQLNKRLLRGGDSAEVTEGDRLILGGHVRLKLVRF